jgi:hypothetical protein
LTSDEWFEETTHQIAVAIRAKKIWILTPKSDTYSYLVKSMSDILVAVASGNWDALEKSKPEKISARQLWSARFKNFTRVIIAGAMPLPVIWGIQNSSLALSKPMSDYVIGGAILWALFTVLTSIDPLFGTKVNTFKEVINILPIPGKKS